jgi:hypothetical protein
MLVVATDDYVMAMITAPAVERKIADDMAAPGGWSIRRTFTRTTPVRACVAKGRPSCRPKTSACGPMVRGMRKGDNDLTIQGGTPLGEDDPRGRDRRR